MTEEGTIKKILHYEKRDKDLIGVALVEDTEGNLIEATFRVGGRVKIWHDPTHDKIKLHVKYKA